MATRTVNRVDLIGLNSVSFIRPQDVNFSIVNTKPLTRLYGFFDGVSIDQYVTPTGGSLGGIITTDAAGKATGKLSIPAMTFNTGKRVLKFQDSPTFDTGTISGATVGTAAAEFTANGVKRTLQETITSINTTTVTIVDPAPFSEGIRNSGNRGGGLGDPLAQTFFTYGVTGGCFVTKIDLFFQAKDDNLPVILEIRHVINGYPGPEIIHGDARVTLSPSQVNISSVSGVATPFTFSRPIYLEEDKEYCFVLMANSNQYLVWTSKLSEKSIETGKTIFEQPHIGSMFKSENNVTWSAEQSEDIKFTLYKALFDTNGSDVTFKANAVSNIEYGTTMTVTSGSPVVSMKFNHQHGQKTGDKIILTGQTNGNYRGILNATISNVTGFTVTYVDDFTLTFNVGTNATSTGTIDSCGFLSSVYVQTTGSGYVSPSISVTGGGGSGAVVTPVVVGGKIVSVTVTTPGTNYTSTPTLTVTDSGGSGAIVIPVSDAIFTVPVNSKYQSVMPVVAAFIPTTTNISNTIRTSSESYVIGTHEDTPINSSKLIGKLGVLVSPTTETTSFGGQSSTQMITRLESSNANVSPMVWLSERPRLRLNNYMINSTANAASETSATAGTAQSRYISKPVTLATQSKGARVLVNAASTNETNFEVYIRTSMTIDNTVHTAGAWVKMTCDVTTNASATPTEYKDYTFYKDNIAPFDVYDIKIVLYSSAKYIFPRIANYRTIILAT
jgi:hypothetical protein